MQKHTFIVEVQKNLSNNSEWKTVKKSNKNEKKEDR